MSFAALDTPPESFEVAAHQIDPLLKGLESPSPVVRLAALRALVHLPLDRDAWPLLSSAAGQLVDEELSEADQARRPELDSYERDLINLAALIPTVSMRNRLYRLLVSREYAVRQAAAGALAETGDGTSLPVLLDASTHPDPVYREQTAERLSLVSVLPVTEQMSEWLHAETDPDTRFWLALALAHAGQEHELIALSHQLAAGQIELRASAGDPAYLLSKVMARGLLPDFVLNKLSQIPGASDHPLLGGILHFSRVNQDLTPLEPPPGVEPPLPPQEAIELADQIQAGAVQDVYDVVWGLGESINRLRELPPDRASSLVSSLFTRLADVSAPGGAGNPVVELVARLSEPFQPDFLTLFETYRRASQNASLASQIAWSASRGGLPALVSILSEAYSSPDDSLRLAAFQFTAQAAQAADQPNPPILGAGGFSPGGKVGTLSGGAELIEDDYSGLIDPFDVLILPGGKGFDDEGLESVPPPDRQPASAGRRRRRRVVNQGFAGFDKPSQLLDKNTPLQPEARYWFWLDIGAPSRHSIGPAVEIPADMPVGAVLMVALFGFEGELVIDPQADIGELAIHPSGRVLVKSQPLGDQAPNVRSSARRLFFPVTAPAAAGRYRMRCNLYYNQVLLQSWLVSAQVGEAALPEGEAALSSQLYQQDYGLLKTFNSPDLHLLPEHRLSILLNRNENGTHSFHLFGGDAQERFKSDDVRFGEGELGGLLEQARGTLRLTAWKNAQEWQEGIAFSYQDRRRDLARLKGDLRNLALWGYEFYDKVISRLAGGEGAVEKLENLLRTPGMLQIALKESPSYVLPAALIYDSPLDTGLGQHTFCPAFERAFQQSLPLEGTECFRGNCPSYGDDAVICPSGFWGFRHALGMPLSGSSDVVVEIPYQDQLRMVVGYASDLTFHREHTGALKKLSTSFDWKSSDLRDELLEWMKESGPHVIYFYCHGGLVREQPYLQVGPKTQPGRIMTSNFRAKRIRWDAPHPLVFINGCHTTSVEPRQALEFISPLVSYSQGAGVIGTEITIYEELAGDFASAFFKRFLAEIPAGEAVRLARLELLSAGNPLGLVYIPFVLAGLKLRRS